MDPGHRQFLMSTYEALEMAGYSDGQTRKTDPNRIAAFLRQCTDDWYPILWRVGSKNVWHSPTKIIHMG